LVPDLDDARARVWELNVTIARYSGTPDFIFRRRDGSSLYICDSEFNEIELIGANPARDSRKLLDDAAFDRGEKTSVER
jgi:hypothetical protein